MHARAVLAGHAQLHALRGADAEEHGLVALVPEALQREVAAQRLAGSMVDAHALDHADLAGELSRGRR